MDTVSGFTSVTNEEDRVKTKKNLQQFQLQLNNYYFVIDHPFFPSPSAFFIGLGHPPFFFFRLALNAFPDIGLGRQIKKKTKKKNHKKSQNRRPWYPSGMTLKVNIDIFGLTKCTIYSVCKKCSCFCSCCSLCCYYAPFSD